MGTSDGCLHAKDTRKSLLLRLSSLSAASRCLQHLCMGLRGPTSHRLTDEDMAVGCPCCWFTRLRLEEHFQELQLDRASRIRATVILSPFLFCSKIQRYNTAQPNSEACRALIEDEARLTRVPRSLFPLSRVLLSLLLGVRAPPALGSAPRDQAEQLA